MKYVKYFFIGFLIFIVLECVSISVGTVIGSGPYEVGITVTALSMLGGIIVICTCVIVDAIREKKD